MTPADRPSLEQALLIAREEHADSRREAAAAYARRVAARDAVLAATEALRLADLFPEGVPLTIGQRVDVEGFAPGEIVDVYLRPGRPPKGPSREDLRGVVEPDDETRPRYLVRADLSRA